LTDDELARVIRTCVPVERNIERHPNLIVPADAGMSRPPFLLVIGPARLHSALGGSRMEALLNISELLKKALAGGAVGFTLRTGLHPIIYSTKGVQTYDNTQPTTLEDIEEILRQLMSSREMRQFRATGAVHFKCVFDRIPLLGGTKTDGEEIRVELRKLAS
jgi:hypothetical protein